MGMESEKMTEISAEEELQRIKEDHLAKNHCGYFKLYSMKLSRGRDNNWGHLPWIKDDLIGIFPTREPCEALLDLIEHGPEATYVFCTFNRDIDHIRGHWDITLDEDGVLHPNKSLHNRNAKWDWSSYNDNSFERGGEWSGRFTGKARTKARATEVAQEAKVTFEEFVRVERPKRAEGCYCDPWNKQPCGKCERVEVENKKKECGCPHCEGDH